MVKPHLKKALGQNFLVDRGVIADLIDAARIDADDQVLEIGAGEGAVTKELAKKAGKVIAVEIDRDLIPTLKESLKDFKNVEIVNADILKLEPNRYTLATKIVGSIPYQITSPLIHQLLSLKNLPKTITFIVQKEVAEKIVAATPKATYLSNFVAHFGKAEIIRVIKPGAFRPAPNVSSAILRITLNHEPLTIKPERLRAFLHRGFVQPRKIIKRRFPAEVLEQAGINSHLRPAALSKEDWRNLYRQLSQVHERDKERRGGGTWVET